MEEIMTNHPAPKLNLAKRVGLAMAGLTAIMLPVSVAIFTAPPLRAQAEAIPKWEAVSIKRIAESRCDPRARTSTPGRLNLCGPLAYFIQASNDVYTKEHGFKPVVMTPAWTADIEGAPAWLDSELYQIDAKAEGNPPQRVMAGPMLQALFEDRLKLKTHFETRVVPVYELTLAQGAPKLRRSDANCVPYDPTLGEAVSRDERCTFFEMTIGDFARYLDRNIVRRPVVDKVGMAGRFNFHLEFAPDESTPLLRRSNNQTGPSIFTAIQEQLGLKLEPATGPHEFLVIDSVERPSEN